MMITDFGTVLDIERSVDCVGSCPYMWMGKHTEMGFEQGGCSGRVLPIENRSMSGQFKNLSSDVYSALKSL